MFAPADTTGPQRIEIVSGDVREDALHLHVKSALREPVIAANAMPTLTKSDVDEAVRSYGPYVLEHVHVAARARVVFGKVVAASLIDAVEGPIDVKTELDRHFVDVELLFPLSSQDPLVLSFDLLADHEAAPGVPWATTCSVDIQGWKKWHAELTKGATLAVDVVEPSGPPASDRERVDSSPGRRSRRTSSGFIGLVIFVALLYIGYSVLQRFKRK